MRNRTHPADRCGFHNEDQSIEQQHEEEHQVLAKRRRRKRKQDTTSLDVSVCNIRRIISRMSLLLAVAVILHESIYYYVLNRLNAPGSNERTEFNATNNSTRIGIVSLHRGFKFTGYLGTWLDANKATYASRHHYAYFNEQDFYLHESEMKALSPWQSVYHRRVKFDKLRFLFYLLQHSSSQLQYLLWMDGDAIFANRSIRIEDQITTIFERLPNFLFVWAQDSQPNTGVLLLRNCAETRHMLETSLQTYRTNQMFMDQASLIQTVNSNRTYSSGQLLLVSDSTRQLQSRVRGPTQLLYQPGDWILHLPNHNRIEFLISLSKWLRPRSV